MLLASLVSWLWLRPPPITPPVPALPPINAPPPHSPSEVARREACQSWTRAQKAAMEELEVFEGWDQRSAERLPGVGREHWRRLVLAGDRSGELGRARAAALRAERLARTAGDQYEAAALLTRIECDLGHHAAELQQARIMMRLAPRRRDSLAMLQRAAECNGLKALARQASRALAAFDARRLLAYQARERGALSAPSPPSLVAPAPIPCRPRASRSAEALRKAHRLWGQALIAAKPELEPRLERDPESMNDRQTWHQLMQRDQGGSLHRARDVAQQALAAAHTEAETYQATVWLAIIDRDLGDHERRRRASGACTR